MRGYKEEIENPCINRVARGAHSLHVIKEKATSEKKCGKNLRSKIIRMGRCLRKGKPVAGVKLKNSLINSLETPLSMAQWAMVPVEMPIEYGSIVVNPIFVMNPVHDEHQRSNLDEKVIYTNKYFGNNLLKH